MRVRYLLTFAALAASTAAAQSTFTWHTFDAPIRLNPKLELVVHERVRTRRGFGTLDQIRGGPILRWRAASKATLLGGYYFQPQHTSDERWVRGHRFFAGVESTRPLGERMQAIGRLTAERFFSTGRPDYNRYRSYLRLLIGKESVRPYLQNEWLAVRQGFHSVRNSGGLRMRLSPHVIVEAGLLYDIRRTFWGGDRFAILTGIRYQHRAE